MERAFGRVKERQSGSADHGQLWTLCLAKLIVDLQRKDWAESVARTKELLSATDDADAKHLLGIGLAILQCLAMPDDHDAANTLALEELPTSKRTPLEHFRASAVNWIRGKTAQEAFSFPVHPSSAPFEAFVIRLFIAGPLAHGQNLELGLDGAWAILPSGRRVSLSAKPAMRRLLMTLIEGHKAGAVLSTDELFERGWPGESVRGDSARNRVRVGLSRLRKAGFAELLERTPEGIRFRPSLEIVSAAS